MDRQKFIENLDNFWYHYKVHVLVAVLAVGAALFIFLTWEKTEDAAINVVIIGNDVDKEQQMTLQKSATKDLLGNDSDSVINIDFWVAYDGLASGRNGDLQGKLMAMHAGGDIDVFIMDDDAFHMYSEQATFQKMESFQENLPEDTQYVSAKGRDESQHIYGIKMDDNQRLKEMGYDTKDKVLAIASNTEYPKLSSQWVNWLLKQ